MMGNIHKRVFINRIAEHLGDSQENIKNIIDTFTAQVIENLKEGKDLEFRDFGVFRIKNRPARIGINPRTKEKVKIGPKRHVHFKMSKMMKRMIQKKS